MKWYDYIGVLGLIILGIAIFQSFSLNMYMDYYIDYFSIPYLLSSYEIDFFLRLYGTGITLSIIGLLINRLYERREKRTQEGGLI